MSYIFIHWSFFLSFILYNYSLLVALFLTPSRDNYLFYLALMMHLILHIFFVMNKRTEMFYLANL